MLMRNSKHLNFKPLRSWPKFKNANTGHDGILPIGKFTQVIINRKFHVATEIGSTFFGCWSVTGQLKK
jgi:hypothetical protein